MAARKAIALPAIVVALVGWVALTGCGSAGSPHPRAAAVVASTDVWGSVARAVAGDHVTVKSIVIGTNADPHAYDPSPADAAAIIDASLVVYNGGKYDPWVDRVLVDHPTIAAIDAYSLLPPAAAGGGSRPNEHVFYDLDVAKSVTARIADRLAAVDPHNAADYQANTAEFARSADAIADSERAIGDAHPGARVMAPEQVAYYLLVASGLTNGVPAGFAEAADSDHEPSPADMASALDLINRRQVAALLVNPQTTNAATAGLAAAAHRARVPVVEVTETLPTGTDYLSWQRNTVNQLAAALQSSQ